MDEVLGSEINYSNLNSDHWRMVFSFLPPTALKNCLIVNKLWRDILLEDYLWQKHCESIFQITDPHPFPSFRAAYAHHHSICNRYADLGLRSIHAWQKVRKWLLINAPEIAHSLRPGATESQLQEAEEQLQVHLPDALRVLYRIHDGQDLEFDRQIDNSRPEMGPSVFHGIFGGYQFYSHVVSTRMLPLRRLIRWTERFRHRHNLAENNAEVIFAAGFNFNKRILCNTENAQVLISHIPALGPGAPVPASKVPNQQLAAELEIPVIEDRPDGVLQWFEHYAEALCSDHFSIENLVDEMEYSRGICLFSRQCPTAITRGVSVAASPLFIPELSNITDVDDGDMQYFFAYSIKFRLLSVEEQELANESEEDRGRPFSSVQLLDRHWLIQNAAGAVESEVQGEGVVGLHPLLKAGGGAFTYQSCTHQRESSGSMEGSFTMIEGEVRDPGPRQVNAVCPRFQLEVPNVIF